GQALAALLVTEPDAQLLRPAQTAAGGVLLLEGEPRDAAVLELELRVDARPGASIQTRLHCCRSSGVRRSSTSIRSDQVALPKACAERYSRSPSRNDS